MEVNSSKCAQGKMSRLGQVNVVGIRSVVAHILTFSLVSVQQSPALIGSTVHVVHASICWSCYRRFRMHTLIRYDARDSKRNVACDVSERRDAGKNDTRGSILVIRPIIALEFLDDAQEKWENFVSTKLLICSKGSDYKLQSLHL